jgi:hypothetical protein
MLRIIVALVATHVTFSVASPWWHDLQVDPTPIIGTYSTGEWASSMDVAIVRPIRGAAVSIAGSVPVIGALAARIVFWTLAD